MSVYLRTGGLANSAVLLKTRENWTTPKRRVVADARHRLEVSHFSSSVVCGLRENLQDKVLFKTASEWLVARRKS